MDLSRARQRARDLVESTLTDTVTITVDAEGTADDALDPVTLALVPAAGDPAPLYHGCAAVTRDGATGDEPAGEGGATVYDEPHQARIPASSDPVPLGAVVHVDDSGDPHLVGREFTVVGHRPGTHSLTQRLVLEARRPGPRR